MSRTPPSRGFGWMSGAISVFALLDFIPVESREPRPIMGIVGVVLAIGAWIAAKGDSDAHP